MEEYAAMEPGERHREHGDVATIAAGKVKVPQWSPVNVTGNTRVVFGRKATSP